MEYTLLLYKVVFYGQGESRIYHGTHLIPVKIEIHCTINNGYHIQINQLRAPYYIKDAIWSLVDINVKDRLFSIGVDESKRNAKSYNHILSLVPERCERFLLDPQPQSNKVCEWWTWFGSDLATSNAYRTKFDDIRGHQVEQINLFTGRRITLTLHTLLWSNVVNNLHTIFEQSVYNNCHIVANENNSISTDHAESIMAVFCDENYKAQAVYYLNNALATQGENGIFFYSTMDGLVYNSQGSISAQIGYELHQEEGIKAVWNCVSISRGRIFAFQVNGIALYRSDGGTVLDFQSYSDLNIDFAFDPNNNEDNRSSHNFRFTGPPMFLKYFPYFDLVLEKTLNQPIRFWHFLENKFVQCAPIEQDGDFKQYWADSILVNQNQQWTIFCFQELSICLVGITDLVRLISNYIV